MARSKVGEVLGLLAEVLKPDDVPLGCDFEVAGKVLALGTVVHIKRCKACGNFRLVVDMERCPSEILATSLAMRVADMVRQKTVPVSDPALIGIPMSDDAGTLNCEALGCNNRGAPNAELTSPIVNGGQPVRLFVCNSCQTEPGVLAEIAAGNLKLTC